MPLRFLDYSLDPANAQLRQGTTVLALRPKTLAMLQYLAERAGRLVTKAELLDAIWPNTTVGEGVLTSSVKEIRRALADDPRQPRVIATAHKHGYRFIATVHLADAGVEPAVGTPLPADSPGTDRPSALIGRAGALADLDRWLQRAAARERQICFIAGEVGIGKTALVDTFIASAQGRSPLHHPPTLLFAHGHCLEQHSASEPYLPVLEAIGRLCATAEGEELRALLRRHAPAWLLSLPALVDEEDVARLARHLGGTTRERMLREMTSVVEALSTPLVLVLEDLQWSDHATLDLVGALAHRPDPAPLMLLATYRPVDVVVHDHPLHALRQELHRRGRSREIWLSNLDADDVEQYLKRRCPGIASLPRLARDVHDRTDGNPLFVVNVVDYLTAASALVERDGQWAATVDPDTVHSALPQGVRQMIAAQIDRIGEAERTVLEASSLVGRTFSAATVAAALDDDVVDVETRLDRLARREQFVRAEGAVTWPDGTSAGSYALTHALYEHVLRERVPPARRQRLHHRIAMRLERGYGGRANDIAAELAFHFEAGGEPERAVPYLEEGATRAIKVGAQRTAVALLERGLALLDGLPATPERRLRTIRLNLSLAQSLAALRSFADPAVERTYARAFALSEATADLVQMFQALVGLHGLSLLQGRLDRAADLSQQIRQLTERLQFDPFTFVGNLQRAMWAYHAGELSQARGLLEAALALDEIALPPGTMDLYCQTYSYLALTSLVQGCPDQARSWSTTAAARAATHGSPFDRATTAGYQCFLAMHLRDAAALASASTEATTLGLEYGFPLMTCIGALARGHHLAMTGAYQEAAEVMRDGFDRFRATGQVLALPTCLGLLAEAHAARGATDEALLLIAEARALAQGTGEIRLEPEWHRIEGAIRQQRNEPAAATQCFRRAIATAQRQGARWWELRAQADLVQLGDATDTRAGRRDLQRLVASLTEGFDTADVRRAHALLRARNVSRTPARARRPPR